MARLPMMRTRLQATRTHRIKVDPEESAHDRGYTHAWQKARKQFLAHNPLCVFCAARGDVTLATVVDHIEPHRGDKELFWDRKNWQPLCKWDHDSTKQKMENSR